MKQPRLVVSDEEGTIFEIPKYRAAGSASMEAVLPEKEQFIPLPYGSTLYRLPERTPLGWDPRKGGFLHLKEYRGRRIYPVAAFIAPAYLHFYSAAFSSEASFPSPLPLYCYAAVGWRDNQFVVPAARVDLDTRQDLINMDPHVIEEQASVTLKRFPGNRLAEHLVENCVRRYCCPAARNFVLRRWEAPLPTSPLCNADCIGCISRQPGETGVVSPQERIAFIPTPEEVAEIGASHLEEAPRGVVSFGQGCEGEPLMVGEVLREAIVLIRKKTDRGVINLNTNGSRPDVVETLCQAGLDSIRVSMNSAREEWYNRYFKPRGYGFTEAGESLSVVRRHKGWSSINYFIFPGFTDSPQEMEALAGFIREKKINMIQARNLNIDPQWYVREIGIEAAEGSVGIKRWLDWVKEQFPRVKIGYFNPPGEEMKPEFL